MTDTNLIYIINEVEYEIGGTLLFAFKDKLEAEDQLKELQESDKHTMLVWFELIEIELI